jgi:replicative DNA helicase
VGKTALALNLARNAAMHPTRAVPVLFFSMEMSKAQLVNRMISSESGVWLDNILTGRIDNEQIQTITENGIKPLSKAQIHFDDTPAQNIFQIRSTCRSAKRKHRIELVIIDYLQLMSGTDNRGNREQEISKISRDLKGLAKELQVPIIALSQLSRKTEERKGEAKTPQLSDLRESGAIEQDADMVMFMFRPEYYNINEDAHGASLKGETRIEIGKNRSGKLAKGDDCIKLKANLGIQKFETWVAPLPDELPKGGKWKGLETPKSELPF